MTGDRAFGGWAFRTMAFIQHSTYSFNKWLTKELHVWQWQSNKRMPLSLQLYSSNRVDGRWTICSKCLSWLPEWDYQLYWLNPPCLLASFPISCQNSVNVSSPSLLSSREPISSSVALGSLAFCGWSQTGRGSDQWPLGESVVPPNGWAQEFTSPPWLLQSMNECSQTCNSIFRFLLQYTLWSASTNTW